jgi:hypothetical protein
LLPAQDSESTEKKLQDIQDAGKSMQSVATYIAPIVTQNSGHRNNEHMDYTSVAKPTLNVATPTISTPTQYKGSSKEEPQVASQHDAGRPTSSVVTPRLNANGHLHCNVDTTNQA